MTADQKTQARGMASPMMFGHGDHGFDCIRLIDVDVMVSCGLHPWEQHPQRPNRLRVNVHVYSRAGVVRDVPPSWGDFIDYDRIYCAIIAWEHRPHTPLLETLAEDLLATCFADPRVDAVRVCVIKPEIFSKAAGAGVEMYRLRNT